MLSFQLEPWPRFWAEAQDLWRLHQQEVGATDVGLDLDFGFYSALETSGQLMIMTARAEGELVGYVMMLIRKHPHYAQVCAFEDAYFLREDQRKGAAGLNLIRAAVFYAESRGAKKIFFHSKLKKDLRSLFIHLGFAHVDELWSKGL